MILDPDNPAIFVEEICKVYRPSPRWLRLLVKSPLTESITALNSVSLEVRPGEICALVGPNGAGKTTIFRILVGLTTPTSGRAQVLGHDAVDESLAIRRRIGWMPTSEQTLFKRHSCADNLRFYGRLYGGSGRALETAVGDALELVDLLHLANNSVTSLSAGMKARLQLARALLHKPDLLILDEPTASVDPVASFGILNLITQIVKERNLAVVLSSHRVDEIEALHSHVVLLNRGEVLFDGDLDSLTSRLVRAQLELEFGSEEAAQRAHTALSRLGHLEIAKGGERRLVVNTNPDSSVGQILCHLDGLMQDLIGVRETRVPLRELLAQVYDLANGSVGPES